MAILNWVLEPSHSELQFKVRHLMISNVTGYFQSFEATASMEENDLTTANISFNAQTSSISTNNAQRDGHLVSADFFDAEKYPTMSFVSSKMTAISGDDYTLEGQLTIKDVTKTVSIKVEFGGIANDPWGNTKAGFTIDTVINRKDFGLNWHAVTEAGGIVVSDEVKIHANLEFVKTN